MLSDKVLTLHEVGKCFCGNDPPPAPCNLFIPVGPDTVVWFLACPDCFNAMAGDSKPARWLMRYAEQLAGDITLACLARSA